MLTHDAILREEDIHGHDRPKVKDAGIVLDGHLDHGQGIHLQDAGRPCGNLQGGVDALVGHH